MYDFLLEGKDSHVMMESCKWRAARHSLVCYGFSRFPLVHGPQPAVTVSKHIDPGRERSSGGDYINSGI